MCVIRENALFDLENFRGKMCSYWKKNARKNTSLKKYHFSLSKMHIFYKNANFAKNRIFCNFDIKYVIKMTNFGFLKNSDLKKNANLKAENAKSKEEKVTKKGTKSIKNARKIQKMR